MVTKKLVDIIERQAETISSALMKDIQSNPYTSAYHRMARNELRHRVIDVYENLGDWLTRKTDDDVKNHFIYLGETRFEEHIPVSQIVYALLLTRIHLVDYLKRHCGADTPLEIYQEQVLVHQIVRFFDKAVFYTVYGYEHACD